MAKRGSITEEDLKVRLETARNEMQLLKEHQGQTPPLFDVIVENDDDFENAQEEFNNALLNRKEMVKKN